MSDVKSVWIDQVEVVRRKDVPVMTLRFFTILPPEEGIEVSRLQASQAQGKAIVDVLCNQLDYYPKKRAVTKSPPKKKRPRELVK